MSHRVAKERGFGGTVVGIRKVKVDENGAQNANVSLLGTLKGEGKTAWRNIHGVRPVLRCREDLRSERARLSQEERNEEEKRTEREGIRRRDLETSSTRADESYRQSYISLVTATGHRSVAAIREKPMAGIVFEQQSRHAEITTEAEVPGVIQAQPLSGVQWLSTGLLVVVVHQGRLDTPRPDQDHPVHHGVQAGRYDCEDH